MSGMLQVADLRVERGGREVLHGVSLAIEPGVISALLGANGAGKSSLVTCIGGGIAASGGSIAVDGVELRGLRSHQVRRRGVAVVSEGHPVLSGLSVADNLRAAGLMLPKADLERRIEEALELFPELRPRLDVDARNLSGGQKQMVNIAQALMIQPRYLLIDELSFGLAPAIVVRLGEVVRRVAATGVGVLLIEQFTTLALQLASRAFVMERGNIVFDGGSAELEAQPEILHGAYLASGASH
jgi:branched-chain amino acid transport system ATP-binding protein